MARAITLGNGNMLVGLDYRGQVRDLYYPYVGQTNHVSGASGSYVHRIGVFVDGETSWLDDGEWVVTIGTNSDSVIGHVTAVNERRGVTLVTRDAVHNEHDVFLRHVVVHNDRSEVREIKVFFAQQFRIAESRRGDTALFDPRVSAIIHYKGKDTFLVNAMINDVQFTEYNIGLFGIEGKEGTWHDAFDGVLEKNPIEHGSVDSIIALSHIYDAKASADIYYWVVCADSIPKAHTLDEIVIDETPKRLIVSTDAYWKAWLEKENRDFSALPTELTKLYRQSLATIRVHTDNRGGIIASSDTDMLHHGRDTYSYVWPRDGAMIARALDKVGYQDVAERFFEFVARCQEPGGYLMHKYLTDGSLGSSWHPWLQHGKPYLPIQEDETASILFALWEHYEISRDLEFVETHYNSFIEPAAKFISEYIEATTGLPQASFDLWEEKYGTSTYTAASVYGGLMAATRFAGLLGKDNDARTYQAIAQRLASAIVTYLYKPELKMFVKQVFHTDDGLSYDDTLDISSFHGIVLFGVLPVDDERVKTSLKTIEAKLAVNAISQGFVRYERDTYYTMQEAGSPNPWVITTLWVAQYYIATATKAADLKTALEILEWTASHAGAGGTLAEQMHPHTREHKSAAPLIWSHAEFVLAVDAYLKKLESFKTKK
ncbi:MAG: glycoside hydrolase family 15 protein [Candidatus Paceibacteria bacterium]